MTLPIVTTAIFSLKKNNRQLVHACSY